MLLFSRCYMSFFYSTLKQRHLIITKTSPCDKHRIFFSSKIENFLENFDIFAQNIICGYMLALLRRGGSNEYPQSMFWSKKKEKFFTPVYPSFNIRKWGMRGYTFHGYVILMIASVVLYEHFISVSYMGI